MKYSQITEAMHRAPVNNEGMNALGELLDEHIAAGVAHLLIRDILEDDDLTSRLNALAAKDVNSDARPTIIEWVKVNLPHLLRADLLNGQQSPLGNQHIRD